MADQQYDVGVRLKGEGQGLVDAGKAGVESLKQVEDQAKRTATALEQQAAAQRAAKWESSAIKQQLDAQRDSQAALGRETDAYGRTLRGATAEVLAYTAAQSALRSILSGLISFFTGPAGIASLIAGAAFSWVSFGTAAEQGARQAEDAAERTAKAWKEALRTLPGDRPSGEYLSAELQMRQAELRSIERLEERMGGPGSLGPKEAVRRLELETEIQRLSDVLIGLGRPEPADPVVPKDKPARREGSDFERLQRQAVSLLAVTEERAAGTEKLTRAELQLAQIEEQYAQGLLKNVTPAQMASVKLIYEQAAANEKEADARAKSVRAAELAAKSYERDMDAGARALAAREQYLVRLRQHNEEIGLTAEQLGRLKIKRAEETLAAEEQAYAYAGLYAASEQELNLARERVEQARRFVSLVREGAARDIAVDQAKRAKEEWTKTNDYVQRTLTDALMRGFERGSLDGMALLKNMFATLVLEPMLRPIFMPVASAMTNWSQSMFAGAGGMFRGAGGAPASTSTPALDSGMDFGGAGIGYAAGTSAATGASTAMSMVPYVGLAIMAASVMRNRQSRREFDSFPREMEAELGMTGNKRAQFNPFGAWMAGDMKTRDMLLGMAAPGLIRHKGDTRRWGYFGGALGAPAIGENRWFDEETYGGASALAGRMALEEQNLMRNLNLRPDQIASVNAALPVGQYDFGVEHTPWEESQAFTRIQADRLQAISSALGRSIAELTSIMGASAEQWEAMIADMRERLRQGERALGDAARALPGQLGITGLEGFQQSLAMSELNAPGERIAAALSLYRTTKQKALGGDLDAVLDLPQIASSALGLGRDLYASGEAFQNLRIEIEEGVGAVLAKQQDIQTDILKDVPTAIMDASNDQIEVLKDGFKKMVDKVEEMRLELVSLQAA